MKVALHYDDIWTHFCKESFLACKDRATETKIIWDGAFLEKNYSWC